MSKRKSTTSASPSSKKSLSPEDIRKNATFLSSLPSLPAPKPLALSLLFSWCLAVCMALLVPAFFTIDASSLPEESFVEDTSSWSAILLYSLMGIFIILPFVSFCVLCAKILYRAGTLLRAASPQSGLPSPFLLALSPFLPVYSLYWGIRSASKWKRANAIFHDSFRGTYPAPGNKLALICSLSSTGFLFFLIYLNFLSADTPSPTLLPVFLLASLGIALSCLFLYCLAYNYLISDVMALKRTHLKLAEIYNVDL